MQESAAGEGERRVWWVNQGSTFGAEAAGGFLWAPMQDKTGQKTQWHWQTMSEVQAGDLILHYADGMVRAVSRATAAAAQEPQPAELAGNNWQRDGWLVRAEYFRLRHPVALSQINTQILRLDIEKGPLTSVGGVKQSYLCKFSEEGLRIVYRASQENWPDWAKPRNATEPEPRIMEPERDEGAEFLELMRWYQAYGVVFQSPAQGQKYRVQEVNDSRALVERLDANEPTGCTASLFGNRLEQIRARGRRIPFSELDGTVAVRTTFAQAKPLGLSADRNDVLDLSTPERAEENFGEIIRSLRVDMTTGSPKLYKPVMLACALEAVRDGEVEENEFSFDLLVERFLVKMRELGQTDVTAQQAAYGFYHMTGDLFWMLAYENPQQPITSSPSPTELRAKVRFACLKWTYWDLIQDPVRCERVLRVLEEHWGLGTGREESAAVDYAGGVEALQKALEARGFHYAPWQVAAFVTALRTKPFVILAGITGTGKSRLPQLVGQAVGAHCARIPVRPDWTDSSDLLGYKTLQERFEAGAFLQLVKRAWEAPDKLHVCILDEMNIARVEHYFAEVLSCIEDRDCAEGGGFCSSQILPLQLKEEDAAWCKLGLPPNLCIVGTVNMDESAHGFSRKVLDRAFTLELSEVDLSQWMKGPARSAGANGDGQVNWPVRAWWPRGIQLSQVEAGLDQNERGQVTKVVEVLTEVNGMLRHAQLQVGYRTRDEVALFVLHAREMERHFREADGEAGTGAPVDPLDLALLMKVLPRLVGGSGPIRRTLRELLGWADQNKVYAEDEADGCVDKWDKAGRASRLAGAQYPRTAARLCLMWERLQAEGYTSFWL